MAKLTSTSGPIPPQDVLVSLLDYHPDTGRLFWKERDRSMFPTFRAFRVWNGRYAGKEAFTCYDAYGYLQGNIFNRRCKAHRVICVMVYGVIEGDVDHINGIRDDNRLENLRVVPRALNLRNSTIRSDNTSGHVGVDWQSGPGKWRARIHDADGKAVHIGAFDSLEDAVAARKAAEAQFDYHPNHGKQPSI